MVIIVNAYAGMEELSRELAGIRCEIMVAQDVVDSCVEQARNMLPWIPRDAVIDVKHLICDLNHLGEHLKWALNGDNCYPWKYKEKESVDE